MPCHVAYVHWGFDTPVAVMEWDLTVHDDPGSSVGEYLALLNGLIDGSQFYLGLQTDVHLPGTNRGVGKGLIFSTWWSFNEADTRVAEDGFCQLGTHEGNFVGIRRPYQWTSGDYRVTLRRAETEVVNDRAMDWFELSIGRLGLSRPGQSRPDPVGPTEPIGALRFPRRDQGTPARIEPPGAMFLEVYSGARKWAEVTAWSVDVMAFGDGVRCPSGRIEYPRYPHDQVMPNSNVRYDAERQRVHLSMGAGVIREEESPGWP